jgi:Flp pilus assembly pilin Flp
MIRLIARMYAWRLAGDDHGQATTEYALVMLGAAVIALLVVGWATSGDGGGKIGNLFDRVIDAISGKL